MVENTRERAELPLLTALVSGMPVAQAAEKAGICERTAYKWLADQDFKDKLATMRAEILASCAETLNNAAPYAAATLINLMDDTNQPWIRLQAARTCIELGLSMRRACDFEERLLTLERRRESEVQTDGLPSILSFPPEIEETGEAPRKAGQTDNAPYPG